MTLPQMVISGCLLAAALPFGLVGTCSLAMAVNEWDTVSFLMGAVILAIGIGLMALGLINARN